MAGFNMAGRKRHSSTVDYVQLNSLSSVVLYDTGGKRKTGRFYEAERVIQRRTVRHDHEYLIKWRGWPLEDCSWEPSENLSKDLLRSFVKPIQPSDEKLQNASCQFASGVLSALKSSSLSPVYVNIQLDVWRYITFKKGTPSEHRGHFMFTKNDFSRFKWLSDNWWYYLDQHGEGMAVDFPIKIKPVLSWSPAHFIKKAGKLCKAKKFPLEKLCLTIAKEPCTLKNMDVD